MFIWSFGPLIGGRGLNYLSHFSGWGRMNGVIKAEGGPEDLANTRIPQTIVSGIPPVLGPSTKIQDGCVCDLLAWCAPFGMCARFSRRCQPMVKLKHPCPDSRNQMGIHVIHSFLRWILHIYIYICISPSLSRSSKFSGLHCILQADGLQYTP